PFGALQEIIGNLGASALARRLGWPRLRLKPALAARLAWGGPLMLALLILAALVAPGTGERLNEVEPFKTAITVGFDREWPYLAYALGLLVLGASYYKFFCRFLCPLGAALSLGSRLRRWNWLPRRNECGQACQRCHKACAYDAIAPSGQIRYEACFQCLDCVGLYHDPERCSPVVLHARKGRTLAQQPVTGK
ncbi:MAG: 4Fe-4S binding protein, partial [Zoogloea sp.]|uniref:4Fe-4S binding protein n=1 Tax=Zoogloea sp. TaxID=49181 RepID=UPI003F2A4ADA